MSKMQKYAYLSAWDRHTLGAGDIRVFDPVAVERDHQRIRSLTDENERLREAAQDFLWAWDYDMAAAKICETGPDTGARVDDTIEALRKALEGKA